MMLIIFGLPQEITLNDLNKLIQEECRITIFLLGEFLQDGGGKKNIKICVLDGIEADLVKKGLDGYKLSENILSVAPVVSKIDFDEKVKITNSPIPYLENIDNQVSSTFKADIKLENLSIENIPTETKKKRKRKRKRLAAKLAMNLVDIKTPFFIGDLIPKQPIQCEPDLSTQQQIVCKPTVDQQASSEIQEPTTSTNVEENRKRSTEMTKSDELVLDMMKKRTKQDVPTIEEPCICAVITSGLTGYLCQDVANLVLQYIQFKLIEDSKIDTIDIPVFRKSPVYMEGVIKLFCADEKSYNWLEMVVVNPEYMDGIPLVINRVNSKGKFLCGIIVPNCGDTATNPRFILRMMFRQNRWIDVQSWQFVGSEQQRDVYFMKVLVPKDHLDILVGRDCRMSYSIGSVYVKFLGKAKKLMFKKYQTL